MQVIDVGGRAMHVAVSGDPAGTPLVFVNSLGTDLRVWEPLLPHLPPGLRFVRYDKRGHGLSDGDGNWTIGDLADDLETLLDTFSIGEAVLCGLSVGGQIAQEVAARDPGRVRALVLCNTAARIGTASIWEDRIRAVTEDGIAPIADAILERWFSPRFRAEEAALALWRNMLVRTPPGAYAATCTAIRDADLTEKTRRLRMPVLAVAGEADGATPPDIVRGTADLVPGARFEVIPGCGHLPPAEAPAALAALLADFLKGALHD